MAITVFSVPVKDLHPNLVTLDTRGLSGLEILLLTHCITLTPGTTSVDVAEDKSWIMVHALDGRKPKDVRASIEGAGTPVPADLLRLSVGIEDAGDLIADLDSALSS